MFKKLDPHRLYHLRIAYEIFTVFIIFSYTILLLSDALDTLENQSWFTESRLLWIDKILLLWFWIEYIIRLANAPIKKHFIKRNWIDLIAMLPLDSWLRPLRILRLLRLFRLVRMSSFLWGYVRSRQIQLSFFIALSIILWGAGGVFLLEKAVNPGIVSFPDAIWWAVVTTTTVGYGDISPVTFGGRLIAIILMFTGIGLIGSVTASVAAHFTYLLEHGKHSIKEENRVQRELKETAIQQVEKIEKLNSQEYESLLNLLHHLHQEAKPKKKRTN